MNNQLADTAASIADQLTPEARSFLIDLCRVSGNGHSTAETLAYYRSDLYTWYDAADLMDRYSRSQIGGFLAGFHEKELVCGKGREAALTLLGVEIAILVA